MSQLIDLGKLRFHFAGNWDQATTYESNDIVKYGGNVYVYTYALKSAGVLPTDATRWALMIEGFNFQGEFSTTTNYKIGDGIAHGGVVYISIKDSTNVTPPNPTYWSRFLDGIQYEGDYVNTQVYQKNDIVKYGGSVFVAKQDTVGHIPTNATYWDKFVEGVSPEGVYNDATAYLPNDLVAYGANIYRAKTETTGNAPSNTTYWELYVGGIKFQGAYSSVQEYYVNDLVVYGNNVYRARQTQSNVLPTVINNWELLTGGSSYKGQFVGGTTYYQGDVVNYGGNVYIALQVTTNNLPTDGTYWSVYTSGFDYQGAWSSVLQYKINQVVTYGGSLYQAKADNDNTNPTVSATWEKIVAGFKVSGVWETSTEYATDEVVTYGGNTFISILPHASTDFNADLAAGKWQKFNGGIRWMGTWESTTQYYKDDVVKAGSSSFIASQDVIGGSNPAGGTAIGWTPFATGAEGFLSKDGDAMLGMLTLFADPTDPLHAATKAYADRMVNAQDGGSVFGPLVFDNVGDTDASLTLQNGSTLTIDGGSLTLQNGSTLEIDGSSVLAEVTVGGDINLNGDLNLNTGNIETVKTSIDIVNTNATTVNFAGAGTDIEIGATTGQLTLHNATTKVDGVLDATQSGTSHSLAAMDPTGWDNQHPSTRGIIEFSDNGTRVYSIGTNGLATVREDSKFATGTAYQVTATANTIVVYPAAGQTKFEYYQAGVKYVSNTLKSLTLSSIDGFNCVYFNGTNLASTNVRTDAILTRYANVAVLFGSTINDKINSLSDERHGISMDGDTLAYTIRADGTQYISGTGLTATAGNPTYTNTKAGELRDADLVVTIPEKTGNKFLTRLGTAWKLADFDDNLFTYQLGTLEAVAVTTAGSNYKASTTTVEVQGDGEGATVSLQYSASPIDAVTLTAPGHSYAHTTTATIAGNGTGATVDVVVPPGYNVATATLTSPGAGYINPVITVSDAVGVGSGAVITPTLALGTPVAAVHMTALGSGYTTATATITGDGTGATASVTIVAGAVTDIDLTNAGSGYTYANVTITGDGTGAAASVHTLKSYIAGYEITNVGSGYTTASVTIQGDGHGATATAQITAGGVTDIVITNGGHGYTYATMSITGDGTGATAVPKLSGYPLASIALTSIGKNYEELNITVTEGGLGIANTTATVSGTLSTGNSIGSVTLTNSGSNYSLASLVFANKGSGTGATVLVETQPSSILGCTVTNSGRHYSYANIVVTSATGSGATFTTSFTPVPQYNGYVDGVTGYDLNNIPAGKYTNTYFLASSSVDRVVKIPSQYLFNTFADAFQKMAVEMKALIAEGTLPFDDYVFLGGVVVNSAGNVQTIPDTLTGDILYADVAIGNYNEIPTINTVVAKASDIFFDPDFTVGKDEYWTIPDDDTTVQTFLDSFFNDYENYKNYWSNISSCVRMYGGIIQDNGDGTVRIGNGGGLYKIEVSSVEGVPPGECEPMTLNGAQGGRLWFKTWNAVQNLQLTNNAYNYIFVTWNHMIDNGDGTWGNTEVISSTNFYLDSWQNDPAYLAWRAAHTELPPEKRPLRSSMLHAHTIGRVYKMDNEITIRVCGTNGWNVNKRLQLFGEEFFPVIRARGLDIEPVPNTLKFNITEGVMWAEMMNRFTVREFNMELGDKFFSWYRHSAINTASTLAQLNTAYPLGYPADADKIVRSTTDDKYYRHTLGWILNNATIYNNDVAGLILTANTGSALTYHETQSLTANQPYKLILNGVTAANIGGIQVKVGTGTTGLLINDLASYTNTVALSNANGIEISFTPDVDQPVAYISVTSVGATSNVLVGSITLQTQVDLGQGFFTVHNYAFNSANVNAWSEVLDYTDNKLIKNTTYPTVTQLTAANPTGYYNLSEDDPANPGYKKDYVVLQLQATDAYYGYNPDAPLGNRWEYIGPKSTALGEDTISVAFIGNVEGMNTTWPNGYTGKVNVIIKTLDGMFYEYSGVAGSAGWYRVQGYVERNGWLRFYGQDAVDPNRYNDTTANTLKPIPPGSYGVAWIYIVHDNTCHVVYGQDYYTNEGAKQAALPTPLPGLLAAYSTLVGKMTFARGSSAFENAESPFLEKFISSGVSLHNDLAGLDGGNAQQNKYYHLDELHYNVVNDFNDFSNDGTLASNSATTVPSQQAVKSYVTESLAKPEGVSNLSNTFDVNGRLTAATRDNFTYAITYKDVVIAVQLANLQYDPAYSSLTLAGNAAGINTWLTGNSITIPTATQSALNALGSTVNVVDTIVETNTTTSVSKTYTINYDSDLKITSVTVS